MWEAYQTEIIVGAAIVAIVVLVFKLVLRKPKTQTVATEPPMIDVGALPVMHDQVPSSPTLEVYHVPAQLVGIVVAPAGRGQNMPFKEELDEILDQITPGFGNVFNQQNPSVIQWPTQLSTEGFVRSFVNKTPLPGDRGKGSEWCIVGGRLELVDYSLLIGLILRADSKNSLGQIIVKRSTQWLDILRVRRD